MKAQLSQTVCRDVKFRHENACSGGAGQDADEFSRKTRGQPGKVFLLASFLARRTLPAIEPNNNPC